MTPVTSVTVLHIYMRMLTQSLTRLGPGGRVRLPLLSEKTTGIPGRTKIKGQTLNPLIRLEKIGLKKLGLSDT